MKPNNRSIPYYFSYLSDIELHWQKIISPQLSATLCINFPDTPFGFYLYNIDSSLSFCPDTLEPKETTPLSLSTGTYFDGLVSYCTFNPASKILNPSLSTTDLWPLSNQDIKKMSDLYCQLAVSHQFDDFKKLYIFLKNLPFQEPLEPFLEEVGYNHQGAIQFNQFLFDLEKNNFTDNSIELIKNSNSPEALLYEALRHHKKEIINFYQSIDWGFIFNQEYLFFDCLNEDHIDLLYFLNQNNKINLSRLPPHHYKTYQKKEEQFLAEKTKEEISQLLLSPKSHLNFSKI